MCEKLGEARALLDLAADRVADTGLDLEDFTSMAREAWPQGAPR